MENTKQELLNSEHKKFRDQYRNTTSGDWQTFQLGLEAGWEVALKYVRNSIPKMEHATLNADKHFSVEYEKLSYASRHEHEGLMWGWQDCVEAFHNAVKEEFVKPEPSSKEDIMKQAKINGFLVYMEEKLDIFNAMHDTNISMKEVFNSKQH